MDRRLNYGRDRLNSYEQMMNGKNASIKQAWVSVVDAQNIKDAKREAGKKLWFSLSPGKEWFKLSFQSFVRYDHFVRFLGIFA